MSWLELFPERRDMVPAWPRRRWYVREVASNGETIGVSEAYASKANAKRAAQENHPDLEIKEVPS